MFDQFEDFMHGRFKLRRGKAHDPDVVGRLWRGFKGHPELFCSVQDDDWSNPYRSAEPIELTPR